MKVDYVGVWREARFSDEILRNIAAHAHAEKGKRVKATFSAKGMTITKARLFKSDVVEVYRHEDIKNVIRNGAHDQLVMVFLGGETTKYKIIALKCDTEDQAVSVVNTLNQHRKDGTPRPRSQLDIGKWSLRDRSAHNANRQLNEIFKEKHQSNGDINGNEIDPIATSTGSVRKHNGILKHSSVTPETSFLHSVRGETDLSPAPGGGEQLVVASTQHDDKDMAYLDHKQLADRLSNDRRLSTMGSIHEKSMYTPSASKRNSLMVKFDTASIASRPRRFSSLRQFPAGLEKENGRRHSQSLTVQRSIEDTYPRPQFVRRSMARHGSLTSLSAHGDPRRYTVHAVRDTNGEQF